MVNRYPSRSALWLAACLVALLLAASALLAVQSSRAAVPAARGGAHGVSIAASGSGVAAGLPRNAPPGDEFAYLPAALLGTCFPSAGWSHGSGLELMIYSLGLAPGNPATLYAGMDALGVYTATAPGGQWNATPLDDNTILSLAVHPTDPLSVYAATWGSGVQWTADGGLSWQDQNDGLGGHHWLYAVAMDAEGSTLYAGTFDDGVYRSDGGNPLLWTRVVTGLGSLNIRSLALGPAAPRDAQTPQVAYAGTADNGVYRSADRGDQWVAANAGMEALKVWSIAVAPLDGTLVYAGTTDNGAWKSEDGGESWTQVFTGTGTVTVYGLAIDPSNSDVVFAGTRSLGVYRTADGGETWQPMNEGLEPVYVRQLLFGSSPCRTLYAATQEGVWWWHP